MKAIEYFTSPDFKDIYVKEEGAPAAKIITPEDTDIINHLLNIIEADYPAAYNSLFNIYGGMAFHKYRMVRRFIKCNFGIYDNKPDHTPDGGLNFEHVPCPMRGECDCENEICNPKFNTNLTKREMEIVKYIFLNLTDQDIADRLFISKFTVENHRRSILRKWGVHNKQGISDYATKHNLI